MVNHLCPASSIIGIHRIVSDLYTYLDTYLDTYSVVRLNPLSPSQQFLQALKSNDVVYAKPHYRKVNKM